MNFNKVINQETRKILSNISWLFSDKVLRMGVGLVLGVWVARYLGPDGFGKWNYGAALAGIFAAIATLGLDNLVVQDLVKEGHDEEQILGSTLVLRLVGSIAAIFMAYLTAYIVEAHNFQLQVIVLITSVAFIFQSFDVIDLYFQSKIKSKYVVIAKNGVFLFCALLRVTALYLKLGLLWFVFLSSFEIFLGAIALVMYYQKKSITSFSKWKFSKTYAVKKLVEGWPIILSGVIVTIYMRIDQIMIKQFLDEKAVGIYSAAVRIVEVWYFIPFTITVSMFPILIKSKEENKSYHDIALKMFKYLFLISFSISIVILFAAEPLIHILFGKPFIESAYALKISIWTGVFVFWGVGAGNIMVIEELNHHNLYKSISSVLLNIALNFVLIPKYGINGAAWATLISQAYASWIYFLILKETRHIFFLQTNSIFKW